MSNYDLSYLDNEYQRTEAIEPYVVPPLGTYKVRLDKAELGEVESNGQSRLKLQWKFIILEGDWKGKPIFKSSSLTSAALPFLKGDLHNVGITAPISQVERYLPGICGSILEVGISKSKEYTNVDILKCIERPQPGSVAPAPAPAPVSVTAEVVPDDDVPF